jgi:hypothetical protein
MLAALPRSERRAASRDAARANPIPAREPSHGLVAEIVHQRHRGRIPFAGTTSGQRRINAKREARAAFWAEERRTVSVRASVEIEPHFRKHIGTLGAGARIDGRTPIEHEFSVDLAVHIPGAPATAVRAMPTYRGVWNGDHYEPELDSVEWMDANGKRIHPEVESILADAREGLLSPNAYRAQMNLPPYPTR